MDVASIPSLQVARTEAAVQVAVLKKAIDIGAAGALALIEALPPPPGSSPPNLGRGVDTWA